MKIKTKMKVQKIPTSQLIFFVAYTLYLIFALLSTSFYYKYFEGRVYIALKVLCLYLIFFNIFIFPKYLLSNLLFVVLTNVCSLSKSWI